MKQNSKIKKEFSVIILAAGKSERLGFPKLSLKYDDNNIFLQHIVSEYEKFGCIEIVVVINEIGNKYLNDNDIRFNRNIKIVINEHPDWHRFYSLKIGAKSFPEVRRAFIHNVDNPFVNHRVLDELLNKSEKADYISPEHKGKGGHPILLSRRIVRDVMKSQEDQLHFKEFLNQYPRFKVTVDDKKILININTYIDYKNIKKEYLD